MNKEVIAKNRSKQTFSWPHIKEALFSPKYPVRNVILSIVSGIVIGYFVLAIFYGFHSANAIFQSILIQDFSPSIGNGIGMMLMKSVVMGFAGLAVLVGLRCGVLNIGVSGQMTFGVFIAYSVLNKLANAGHYSASLTIILGLLITLFFSVGLTMIAAVLKIYFKVNEVISTIMLNWVVVYLLAFVGQHYLAGNSDWFMSQSNGTSLGLDSKAILFYGASAAGVWGLIIGSIFMLLITVALVWFMFAKTTHGFKLTSIGKNSQASTYAGYKIRSKMIFAFLLSGLCSGMAGFVYFVMGNDLIPSGTQPITVGFMGIVVALVALSNPLGIIPAAILFGILDGPIGGVILFDINTAAVKMFAGAVAFAVAIVTSWQYIQIRLWFKNLVKWNANVWRGTWKKVRRVKND